MDAPKRIWAWTFKDCDWKSAWTVADEDAPPHATAYIRADIAAPDLAELVEAAKPFALLDETDDSIGDFCEKHPVEGGYVADLRAALTKLGVR